jgi:hypothetical protein
MAFAARAARSLALVLLLGACAPSPGAEAPETELDANHVGRTRCPGSVPVAQTNLRGAAADSLEAVQGEHGLKPGFMAVIFDGTQPIVVVEAARVAEWENAMGGKRIAVAPSCVDPELLDAVMTVIPALPPPDGAVTGGYNGLNDSIELQGVASDALLAALQRLLPGMEERAAAAMAAGTLRVDEGPIPRIR